MVGRIRYSNDYGINESCRFGGSAEREKREKKKWECKSRFLQQRSMRFCTLLLVFQLPLPSFYFLLDSWFGSDIAGPIHFFSYCSLFVH